MLVIRLRWFSCHSMLFDSGVGFQVASSVESSLRVFNNRVKRNSAFSCIIDACSDKTSHQFVYSQHPFSTVFSSFLSPQPQSDSTVISFFSSEQPQSVPLFLSSTILFHVDMLTCGGNIMASLTKQNQNTYFS